MKFKRHLTYSVVASSLALTAITSSVSSNFGTLNEVHAAPTVQVSSQKTSAWAKPYVDAMNKAGLVPGSLTNADLTQKISRVEFAELITLYVNKAGITNAPSLHVEPFTDTNNPLVKKASELGIVKGVGKNKFDPNKDIERQELATMGTRAEEVVDGYQNYDLVSTFKDAPQISSWARKGVAVMVKKNAIQGVGDGYFKPKDNATREQAIKIVSELADKKGLVKLDRVAISKPVVPKPTPSNPNPQPQPVHQQFGSVVATGGMTSGFRKVDTTLSGNIQKVHKGFKIPTESPDNLIIATYESPQASEIDFVVACEEFKGNKSHTVGWAITESTLKSNLPSDVVNEILDYSTKKTTRDTRVAEKKFYSGKYVIEVKGPSNNNAVYIHVRLK